MDLKRYDQISGLEALKMLSERKRVYPGDDSRTSYYVISEKGLMFYDKHGVAYTSNFSIGDFSKKEWYAKKPFDVRAEMLARPDEWIGAYTMGEGKWFKVAICSDRMTLVADKLSSLRTPRGAEVPKDSHLNRCIPIEEVPDWAKSQ